MSHQTGSCLCGATSVALVKPVRVVQCHCRMCQRATGAAFATWLCTDATGLRWSGARRMKYRSSGICTRSFCATCGSTLTMEYDEGEVALALGITDKPEEFSPDYSIWTSKRLASVVCVDAGLPQHPQDA